MSEKPSIPFFTDHNVPDSVGEYLKSEGHFLTRLRDEMAIDTPDHVLAVACSKSGNVLLTHDMDFRQRQNSKKLDISLRECNNSLHRIILRRDPPNDVKIIKHALPLIETEWLLVSEGRPMYIEINEKGILISRLFW